jgi:hypothetical protein
MTNHQHKLGDPWTEDELEDVLRGLLKREELDGVDAIIWLRFELMRARNGGADSDPKPKSMEKRPTIRRLMHGAARPSHRDE